MIMVMQREQQVVMWKLNSLVNRLLSRRNGEISRYLQTCFCFFWINVDSVKNPEIKTKSRTWLVVPAK